jgi:enoyl-CoA hydratase
MESISSVAADCETVTVSLGDQDRVATVVIDRPDKRNALNATVRSELGAVCDAIAESDVRVVVLTGSDECNSFVAGADVSEFRDRGPLEQRKVSQRPRVYEKVAELPQPVVARVNGHALGGGSELMLACDIRLGRRDARYGQPEINLGIMPGAGATQRLPRLIGEGQAMRLILSGEFVSGDEAARIGLIDEVYDAEDLDTRTDELANRIASKSPVAVEFAKQAIKYASQSDLDEGIEYEAELFAHLFGTEDKDEGIDAFLEDRDPEWTGR